MKTAIMPITENQKSLLNEAFFSTNHKIKKILINIFTDN